MIRETDFDKKAQPFYLYNFRARWYDSGIGRWLSKDPIGLEGGLNLYVFCGNDPVNFVDPNGHNGLVFFSRPWVMFQRPTPVPRPLLQSPKPGTPPNGMVKNLYRPGSFGTGRGSGFKEL